jgi:dTDP-glucose pyrophosphorylase
MGVAKEIWRQTMLPIDATIGAAIRNLEKVAVKIVLVVNEAGILEGTVSDGDIRRGLLKGLDMNSPLVDIVHRNAVVAPPELSRELVMRLMAANKIQQIPIVDERHRIIGLQLWDEITTPSKRSNLMVIMAGGMGTRLRPHTEHCPKPLLPVSGKPMLEHIIDRAKLEGFNHFVLSINYLGHMIEEYFGDGERLGVRIDYLREDSPLGTAGALGLLSPLPDIPIVVTNGDVITDIRYGELLDFHVRYSAAATMAVRVHEWQHPFGVVSVSGLNIVGFEEKPTVRSYINAGVYVLESSSLAGLGLNTYCDMPKLFENLMSAGKRPIAFPIHEHWMDVGRPEDLIQANHKNAVNLDG